MPKRSLLFIYSSIAYTRGLILVLLIDKKVNSLIKSELLIITDIIIDTKLKNKGNN